MVQRVIPLGSPGAWRRRPGRAVRRPEGGRAGRAPWVTLGLVAAALVASLAPGLAEVLQWDRLAVAAGQEWRLVTAHLVHFGTEHLVYDAVALLVLGAACERRGRAGLVGALAVASLAIPAVVAVARPELASYRGLSGLDAAVFALLLTRLAGEARVAREAGRRTVLLVVGVAFAIKLALEFSGSAVFVRQADVLPVPEAHLVGALVGLAFGPRRRPRERTVILEPVAGTACPDLPMGVRLQASGTGTPDHPSRRSPGPPLSPRSPRSLP